MIDLISPNFSQLFAQRQSALNALSAAATLARLATGSAINSAADSPADLIAGLSLDSTLAQLDAQTYVNERASSQAAVADGALESVSSLLSDAKSLAVANADNTLSDAERQANQTELDSILDSVDRISSTANFNGQKLFDGTGSIAAADDSLDLPALSSASIGQVTIDGVSHALVDVGSGKAMNIVDGASGASDAIDQAIDDIATLRGQIGAFDQGTVAAQGSLTKSQINLSSSLSMIRDTDYAFEISQKIRLQILAAAGNRAMGLAGAFPGGLISIFA